MKSDLFALFLDCLVGMALFIVYIICRVLIIDENCFKHKICFVIKRYWGDTLQVNCTLKTTTCTINGRKT